jgi:hypothetical protein
LFFGEQGLKRVIVLMVLLAQAGVAGARYARPVKVSGARPD